MTFKTIHTALKKSIVDDGFKYIEPSQRSILDVDPEQFARSYKNNGFTLRVEGQGFAQNESVRHVKTNWPVEFILDGAHDNYLNKIDNVITAVWSLLGVVQAAGVKNIEDKRSWPLFNTDWRDNWVILTFPNITFTIESDR